MYLLPLSASHASIPVRFRAPLGSMLHSFTPLVDKTPLFFLLWLKLFTVLPLFFQAVKAGCMLQSYVHFLSSAPVFCQLISLLIAFGDERFKCCHLFFFFLRTVCLQPVPLSPRCLFFTNCPVILPKILSTGLRLWLFA